MVENEINPEKIPSLSDFASRLNEALSFIEHDKKGQNISSKVFEKGYKILNDTIAQSGIQLLITPVGSALIGNPNGQYMIKDIPYGLIGDFPNDKNGIETKQKFVKGILAYIAISNWMGISISEELKKIIILGAVENNKSTIGKIQVKKIEGNSESHKVEVILSTIPSREIIDGDSGKNSVSTNNPLIMLYESLLNSDLLTKTTEEVDNSSYLLKIPDDIYTSLNSEILNSKNNDNRIGLKKDNSDLLQNDVDSLKLIRDNYFNFYNYAKLPYSYYFFTIPFIKNEKSLFENYGNLVICSNKNISESSELMAILQFFSLSVLSTFRLFHQLEIEAKLRDANIKSAIAAIMSRNMSHNLGSHVLSGTKADIAKTNFQSLGEPLHEKVRGNYRLLQYLQERMDFLALIINHEPPHKDFLAPLNLKADILDEFAVDGRGKRHKSQNEKTHSYILSHIVSSERIVRNSLNDENLEIEIQLLKDDYGKIKSFTSLANGDNDSNEFNEINFSVPLGVNSRHALLIIMENYIRNIAKHKTKKIADFINKNKSKEDYEKEKLIISLYIVEEKENYCLKIFDNLQEGYGEIVKLNDKINNAINDEEGKNSIRIINHDGSLNRYNKGLKEMLVCAAWLKGETDNWSLLERQESGLLEFISLRVKSNPFYNAENKKNYSYSIIETANESDKEIYCGLELTLPKHKFYHYSKISAKEQLYELPSADIYIVDPEDDKLKEVIRKSLSRFIFFDELDNDLKAKVKEEGNNKETARLLYKALFKDKFKLDKIVISYHSTLEEKDEEIKNKVFRINEEEKSQGFLSIVKSLPKNTCTHLFITHNDSPSIFEQNINALESNNLLDQVCYLEGISGGNFTYNLLCNAPVDLIQYYKILEADNIKIALIDERLYRRYSDINFESNGNKFEFSQKEIRNLQESLDQYKSDKDINKLLRADYGLFRKFFISLSLKDEPEQNKWLEANCTINNIASDSKKKIWLKKKNIFLYNLFIEDEGSISSRSETSIPEGSISAQYKLFDIDQNECKCEKNIDFVSIHYGLIEKLGLIKNSNHNFSTDNKQDFKQFLAAIGIDPETTKISIHSGRGGVIEWQNEITFIPISSIDAQMDDSKFKLAQMFLTQKFKPL